MPLQEIGRAGGQLEMISSGDILFFGGFGSFANAAETPRKHSGGNRIFRKAFVSKCTKLTVVAKEEQLTARKRNYHG